jgi:hypothetical protein
MGVKSGDFAGFGAVKMAKGAVTRTVDGIAVVTRII